MSYVFGGSLAEAAMESTQAAINTKASLRLTLLAATNVAATFATFPRTTNALAAGPTF